MEQRQPYRWWQIANFPSEKAAVKAMISEHVGERDAISSARISEVLQMDRRRVRALVAELVTDGELIGASVDGDNGGYYIISTIAELEASRAILRARATEIFQRDRALCASWQRQHGQQLQPLLPTMGQRRDVCPRSGEL